jgi:CheY-like chemotaxis protein
VNAAALKVLIVEDNLADSEPVRKMLVKNGFTARVCEYADEACKELHTNIYDCISVDLDLRDESTGVEDGDESGGMRVIDHAMEAKIPIVIVSGHVEVNDQRWNLLIRKGIADKYIHQKAYNSEKFMQNILDAVRDGKP